jgi:hypothetical protein
MLDLKAQFGDRYQITYDESATDDTDRETRLWCARISCRFGFISVHGPDTLAAWSNHRSVVKRLAELAGVRVHQRGDHEIRVTFASDRLEEIACILRAKRRRRLSEEHRAKLMASNEQFRFASKGDIPRASTRPRDTA